MTLRDEMIFRPNLGARQQPSARTRAREASQHDRARRKRGPLRYMRNAQLLRKRKRRLAELKRQQRIRGATRAGRSGLVRGAVRSVARSAVRMAGRAVMLNPIGMIVTALLAGGMVLLRLGSGKTFEQMGDEMNNMLIGDLDEQARARMTVRHRFQSDEMLARIRGQSGKHNAQINRIAQDLFRVEKQYEDGKALIEREFGVNGTWDMIILRAIQSFGKAWHALGGSDKMERFVEKVQKQRLISPKRLGR